MYNAKGEQDKYSGTPVYDCNSFTAWCIKAENIPTFLTFSHSPHYKCEECGLCSLLLGDMMLEGLEAVTCAEEWQQTHMKVTVGPYYVIIDMY